ncbi:hypothetical protein GQ53DRAFT_823929 [Thozetella sp. PMI_491]|nr:hypothetical protein GQ53DRAFT_823929 [Thozetella sp. PMI_491]
MGIPASLDPRHRLAIPDTPPELVSPDSLSSSTRQSEDRPWNQVAPISPPMSNYDPSTKTDMSLGKSAEEVRARGENSESAPRTQLPSLSSLFPPSQIRPHQHSPTPDRQPGPYAPSSPYGPATTLDRSFPSSNYFSPTSGSLGGPSRSPFEARPEDRPQIPSLSRFLPPLSPRPREQEQPQQEPRSNYSRWSTQPDTSRSPFHSPQDRLPPPLAAPRREEEYAGGYHEQRTPAPPHILPSTPSSGGVNADAVPVKDGLGPKIWTGTHFLPRFVRSAEVPGEGLCYFYDDGSHCKSVIDGEVVNAHWGVTKAGKPRKRLAIACITCREKKIKCDPDYPRCVQCEKFGRVCKFKNAPRGGHNTSPSTPPAEVDEVRRIEPMIRPPPVQPRPPSLSRESVSPRTTTHRPASPLEPGLPAKRLRMAYDYLPPAGPRSPLGAPTPDTARSAGSGFPWQQPERPRIREDVLCRAWQTDPYVSNPQSVVSTVSSFFVHTDGTALRFLPAAVIKSWVQSAHRKSPEDLMLVYSILAIGAALSGGSAGIANEYAQVARYAVDRTPLTLQLVQAKLLLTLYYLSVSRTSDANDMLSGAVSAATCLQLNLELEKSQDASRKSFPFGLKRVGYAEVRRRTFWACFLLERINGLFPTRVAIINADDIFIRLPADMTSFEEQVEVATPDFEPNFSSIQWKNSGIGIMGYLVQIVAIFGDVMASIYRISHRNAFSSFDFVKFHHHIISRLEDWNASLPSHMVFSPTNLETVGPGRGTFILMHLTYHLTIIKLHRHIQPRFLSMATRYQYASAARDHAWKLLDVVCTVAKDRGADSTQLPPPFTSFAILEAIDVLSAEGSISELPALVDSLALARSVLELLGTVWEDAKVHKMAMDHRLDKLATLRDHTETEASGSTTPIPGLKVFVNTDDGGEKKLAAGPCWQIPDALETRFPLQMDSVYSSIASFSAPSS